MLRVLSRSLKNKIPLFESSHRQTLHETTSAVGRKNREDRFYDPDKILKLQGLVKKNLLNSGVSLSDNVKRLARTDKEFNQFLKQFKTVDEPEYTNFLETPASLDLKQYVKDRKRSTNERIDELYTLDQFRKKKIADQLDIENKKLTYKLDYDEDMINPTLEETKNEEFITKKEVLDIETREIIYFEPNNFNSVILDAGTTTNITKLARVNKRHVLLYMASTDGIISYGRGVGINYQDALEDAMFRLKRNLICINLDHFLTVPGYLVGEYYNTKVEIFSDKSGKSFWGNPLFYNLLAFAGLSKFQIRVHCRNVNYYSILHCFFKCLINNETPRQIAEKTGTKFYEITYGRAWRTDFKPAFDQVDQ